MRGTMEKSKAEKQAEEGIDRREHILIRTRTCALSNESLSLEDRVRRCTDPLEATAQTQALSSSHRPLFRSWRTNSVPCFGRKP